MVNGGTGPMSPAPRTTPPAWDPLGAAPFAWDLPDIDLAPQSGSTLVRRAASPVTARAAMGVAVLTVAGQILGMIAGWWSLGWAAIAGTALAVVAVGLFVQAVRGRSLSLIGPGVVLAVATLALAMAGIRGIATVGEPSWGAPAAASEVQSSYRLGVGDGVLDLSDLKLSAGEDVSTSVVVNVGHARIMLPPDADVAVTCSANVGQIDCVGHQNDGLDVVAETHETAIDTPPGTPGTLTLDVHVGVGSVEVTR